MNEVLLVLLALIAGWTLRHWLPQLQMAHSASKAGAASPLTQAIEWGTRVRAGLAPMDEMDRRALKALKNLIEELLSTGP